MKLLINPFFFVNKAFSQFGGADFYNDEELTPEKLKKQMTAEEWAKIYEMTLDRNLYQNLMTSLFPTIHGKITAILKHYDCYLTFIDCRK